MPERTLNEIAAIVQGEVDTITDPEVLTALTSWLTPPKPIQCAWDYGAPGQAFLCWVVLEHQPSKTGIAYSDFGFGPRAPWGLIWLSKPSFGMDSGWYSTLEDAFCESVAAASLHIWNVVKTNIDGTIVEVLETSLTGAEASEKLNKLNAPLRNNPRLLAEHGGYIMEPRTKHRRF